jgi:hypothetical protein
MSGRLRRVSSAALTAALLLGGCVQATRHSNTMVFGTNTVFGIDAGQNPAGVPSVTVGYRRQEAVIMPLVANTRDNGHYQQPCDITGSADLPTAGVHPCVLVGRKGNSIDTYSVLASFGAEFGGNGMQGTASGGLAQYFATGLAAQALAVRGGAALVAVGETARAAGDDNVDQSLQSLFSDASLAESAAKTVTARQELYAKAGNLFAGLPADQYSSKLTAFETAMGLPGRFTIDYCKGLSQKDCSDKMKTGIPFRGVPEDRLQAAITNAGG